jgi:hypothetical protein
VRWKMRISPVTGFSSLSPLRIMAVLSSLVDVRTASISGVVMSSPRGWIRGPAGEGF